MYEKLNNLAKTIAAAFSNQTDKDDELFAAETINRLSQISTRNRRLPGNSNSLEDTIPDGYISARLKKLEIPEDSEGRPISHWCNDTSRYIRQAIRQGDQLKGVENSFEIDPMSKLPD